MNSKKFQVTIFIICFAFFAPFLVNPKLLTTKDNDLGRTYIPLYSFIKESIFVDNQIPLWRPSQMMGETFVGNPLSSLLYPANVIFLILPSNFAAVFYLFSHFVLAGIFTFLLARSFNLSSQSSLAAGLFYAFSTKMLVHLEAGHITMIAAFSYFPLLLLSVRKILAKSHFNHILLGAIALTFIYITYPTIFYYAVIFVVIYILYKLFLQTPNRNFKNLREKILPFLIMTMIVFGLSAATLLPQLEFAPFSTRSQLKFEDVAIPLWNFKRFVSSLVFPYLILNNLDHESFLYLGIVPSIFAVVGFFLLRRNQQILLIILGVLTLLFVAGQSTPVFKFTYESLPFLKYTRVTTRLWFAVALPIALLAAYGLSKIKRQSIIYLAILIFLTESYFIFNKRIHNIKALSVENKEIYQLLSKDEDFFRVYCTTYCFNPQLLPKYKIQILAGETPIQDAKFVNFLAAAGNYYYPNFAVIFPPYQVWQKENPPIPNADLLGFANVKYIASTYQIIQGDFRYLDKFGDVYLYQNAKYRPRAYFENSQDPVVVKKYSPNRIVLEFKPQETVRNIIISENFYPGWIAYINHQKFNVDWQPPIFRKVTIPANAQSLELKYQPKSLLFGKTITIATIAFLTMYYLHNRHNHQNKKYG